MPGTEDQPLKPEPVDVFLRALDARTEAEERAERNLILIVVGAVVLMIAMVVGATFWWVAASCRRTWSHSGMRAEWRGPVTGCLLEVAPGRWIPEERYREIDR